jgi:glutaredoxin
MYSHFKSDLNPQIQSDIQLARVVVISTQACPYCNAAKNALKSQGIEFEVLDVSHEDEQPLRALVQEITGSKTVPQVR